MTKANVNRQQDTKTKKLLIVGPSSNANKHIDEIRKYIENEDFKVVSFTSGIDFFWQKNIVPDYYVFIDPHTMYKHLKWMVSVDESWETRQKYAKLRTQQAPFFQKIELLIMDFYADDLKIFKECRFTSTSFSHRDPAGWKKFKTLCWYENFKKVNVHTPVPAKTSISNYENIANDNWTENCHIYNCKPPPPATKMKNNDKFSHFLIPLILYHFQALEEIHFAGLGDFDVARFGQKGNTGGYDEFMNSFKRLRFLMKSNFHDRGIKLKFLNSNFFSDQLLSGVPEYEWWTSPIPPRALLPLKEKK